jgi:tetratricopeptide (TPR) repeat protein
MTIDRKSQSGSNGRMKRRSIAAAAGGVLMALAVAVAVGIPSAPQDALLQSLREAQAALQAGLNAWDGEKLAEARDRFLGLLVGQKEPAAMFSYYVGLADFRLAVFQLGAGRIDECGRFIAEGEQYLEKAFQKDAKFGEALALHGYLLGLEIALHPDQAMILGPKSAEDMDGGLALDPDNPRIQYLQGSYWLYVPEAYGGGADRALPFLEKAAALFDKETVTDPLRPSWGRAEAYAYLGIAYGRKNDKTKARDYLRRALAVNPDFGLAKTELAKVEK